MSHKEDNTESEMEMLTPDGEKRIREKILHLLSIYPKMSPTMLQGALGPQTKPIHWKPILEQLIEEGVITLEHDNVMTPAQRFNTYKILSLTSPKEHDAA